MVLRSLLAITMFVGLMGLVTAPWQLLVLRLLQGMFSGFVAAGNTLVSVSTPVERQGRVMGVLQTGLLLGFALGPLLGGVIGDTMGYRSAFFVTSALAASACLVVTFLAREDHRIQKASVGGEGIFRGMAHDLLGSLESRGMRYLLSSLLCFRTSLSLMVPVLPIYLVQIGGFDLSVKTTMASLLFTSMAAPVIFFVALWGWRADRVGPGNNFVLCTFITAFCFLSYGLAWTAWMLIVMRALQGVFLAGIMPSIYAALARLSPGVSRGAAMGLVQSSLQISMAGGTILGGFLAAAMNLKVLFVISCLLMLSASALSRFGWMRMVDGGERKQEDHADCSGAAECFERQGG